MMEILFEKSRLPGVKAKVNFAQNIEGMQRKRRWTLYCAYVDTPDKRLGHYKIVIVWQNSIIKTLLNLLHELTHVLINLIYGEGQVGNRVHKYFDYLCLGIEYRQIPSRHQMELRP